MQDASPAPDVAQPGSLDADLISRFAEIVGSEHALTDPDQQTPYLTEWRGDYWGTSPLILRPGSVEEVSKILALANEHGIAIVPQAGNTGLVGGQTPHRTNSEVVLSVERMKRVRACDPAGGTLTVDAGVTLLECQQAAAEHDRLFPLSLPSEGSCRIGGNIGTNAGGVGVLAYGNTRQLIMGLEVVLADGRVLNDLNTLKKNNTGYDLRNLFIGSEGTLGIVTGAVLKLFPLPGEKATAMVAIPELPIAIDLLAHLQKSAGGQLTAFEFVPGLMVDLVCKHVAGARAPFADHYPWYVLIELSGAKADGTTQTLLEDALMEASEREMLLDAVVAGSMQQQKDLWLLREGISEAQKPEGGNIKHDISVPVRSIPEFVAKADEGVFAICPDARPIALGHFGDGNVHYNIIQPEGGDTAAFKALAPDIHSAVYAVVAELGGSISAEHGIGRIKRAQLAETKDPVALQLMRDIKAIFDPNGIMNPGKVL
ncbi:MAG: FAD-binding oxidoreductase [Pseudomonadota bacterium]